MIYKCRYCGKRNRLDIGRETTRAMRICKGCGKVITWLKKTNAKGRPGALVNKIRKGLSFCKLYVFKIVDPSVPARKESGNIKNSEGV